MPDVSDEFNEFGTNEYGNPTGRDYPAFPSPHVTEGRRHSLRRTRQRLDGTAHRLALARIDRERRRLALEEELLLSRPEEPTSDDGDGPVVFFRKQFGNPGGDSYQYVAVYADAGWYISGKRHPAAGGLSWSQLLDYAYRDEDQSPVIWKATEYEQITADLED